MCDNPADLLRHGGTLLGADGVALKGWRFECTKAAILNSAERLALRDEFKASIGAGVPSARLFPEVTLTLAQTQTRILTLTLTLTLNPTMALTLP